MANGRNLKSSYRRFTNIKAWPGSTCESVSVIHGFLWLELRQADLGGCCLNYTLLDDCDLRGADLTNANLNHASLNRAKLSGAILADVVADGASFKDATGLTPSMKKYLKSKGARDLD